jgi:hypothetical protein
VIDGTLGVRLGSTHSRSSMLCCSAALGRRRVAWARRGSAAFRLALDEIAALLGLATKPRRPPGPERYALQAAVMVTTVRKGAP